MGDTFAGQEDDGRAERGLFAKGNEIWKMRTKKTGPPRLYETPHDLLVVVAEYLEWADLNPLYETKAFGTGLILKVPKMRAPTIQGFCEFAQIAPSTWDDYYAREEFTGLMDELKNAMFARKVEGAAAGMLNANIIARELGLSDKVESDQTVTVEVIDNFEDPNAQADPAE